MEKLKLKVSIKEVDRYENDDRIEESLNLHIAYTDATNVLNIFGSFGYRVISTIENQHKECEAIKWTMEKSIYKKNE